MEPIFEVSPHWDSETASCQLKFQEQTLKPWQISQRALGPLFFGE